jgi:chorismate mutase/prephenate dehydrogenase
MVKKLDMDIDDHDRLIAYVLGLSHALNIAFFTALADSGESAPKLAKLSSTTFDAQLIVSEAVASDSPELYFEIQKLNEYGLAPLNALCASANQIRKVIKDNNKDGFIELMEKGKQYLATRN